VRDIPGGSNISDSGAGACSWNLVINDGVKAVVPTPERKQSFHPLKGNASTILIVVLLVLLLGGGGYYGRGRCW
jgi:hypothetical protein